MHDTLTPTAPRSGAAHSHVRPMSRPAARPQGHHVEELSDQLDLVVEAMNAGDLRGAEAFLRVTQMNLRNIAAAMVTR